MRAFLFITLSLIASLPAWGMENWDWSKLICNPDHCYEVVPFVMVETAFGQAIGHEFRTETGCYLAGSIAARQLGTTSYCFADPDSARTAFPNLKMEAPDATTDNARGLPASNGVGAGGDR